MTLRSSFLLLLRFLRNMYRVSKYYLVFWLFICSILILFHSCNENSRLNEKVQEKIDEALTTNRSKILGTWDIVAVDVEVLEYSTENFDNKDEYNKYLEIIEHLKTSNDLKSEIKSYISFFKNGKMILNLFGEIESLTFELDDDILYVIENRKEGDKILAKIIALEGNRLILDIDIPTNNPFVFQEIKCILKKRKE